jgi:hypothetical protein
MLIPFGFLASAGGAAADYELISTQVLSSNTPSVTFSGLNTAAAAFKHLQLRVVVRSSNGAASDSLGLRFNSDTGSNYAEHVLYGNGSNVLSGSGASQTLMSAATITGNSAAANIFGGGVIDILDFSQTTKKKTVRSLSGNQAQPFVQLRSGLWNSSAAVTSINLFSANGATNLLTGSRFSLYGLKG